MNKKKKKKYKLNAPLVFHAILAAVVGLSLGTVHTRHTTAKFVLQIQFRKFDKDVM